LNIFNKQKELITINEIGEIKMINILENFKIIHEFTPKTNPNKPEVKITCAAISHMPNKNNK